LQFADLFFDHGSLKRAVDAAPASRFPRFEMLKTTGPKQFADVAPVQRRKLYQEVFDRLEAMIASGELAPGDLLPSERELSEMFQVGRTSVREALFSLRKAGLVVIRNGERPYVTRPSAESLMSEMNSAVKHMISDPTKARELQQARAMLEIALVRHAARHATKDDVARLKAALKDNESAVGDTPAFTRTDVAFHLVLAEIPKNSIFPSLHHAFVGWLAHQRTTSLQARGAEKAAYRFHEAIYNAVAAGDADAAEEAMRDHLASVEAYYWKHAKGSK
jgi:GntR family transcriptional regulator, sialic acid-inducible nan operon repressor